MFIHINTAEYVDGFKIKLSFNDGKEGIADLTDALVGPVFEHLKNQKEFTRFQVDKELDTIVWPNGADLAPEYLYFQAFKNDPELKSKFVEWGYIT